MLAGCVSSSTTRIAEITLVEIETGLPQRGQWRDQFIVADLNSDGHADLVHGPPRKNPGPPVIFLGDGSGQFRRWSEVSFPPLPYDYGAVAAGDVNHDGLIDLAVSSHLRGMTVLIAEIIGSFAPWAEGLTLATVDVLPENQLTSRAIELADWNRDGKLDLVAVSEGPARMRSATLSSGFAVYLNYNGAWVRIDQELDDPLFATSLAVGDVNADGFPDALSGTLVAGYKRLLRLGNGEGWRSIDVDELPRDAFVTAVELVNLDGRRGDETLLGSKSVEGSSWRMHLHLGRWLPDGLKLNQLWTEPGMNAPSAIVASDLDGDRRSDDLAVLLEDGTLLVFTGQSEHVFTLVARIAPPERVRGCSGYDLAAADINQDGLPELIASYAGEATFGATGCRSGGGFVTWRIDSRVVAQVPPRTGS